MITQRATDAIEASDTDELLRVIDGYCKNSEWESLIELRARCQEALTRGKQLWGVDEHVRYRLALEAPAQYAGPIVTEGAARFALGPLPEVAASTKSWIEMEAHLEDGPERQTFAAERVVRGDSVSEPIADLPSKIMDWEPAYPVATYKSDKVEAPSPLAPSGTGTSLLRAASRVDDFESEGALADLVLPWSTESNGQCETVTIEGDTLGAIAALGLSRARVAPLTVQEAMVWMAWAGGSGGAYGRRRGAAAGRYGTWWVLASICDLEWPPTPSDVGEAIDRLHCVWFDDGSPGTGWQLRIALADRETGLAWAIAAIDAAD